MKFIGRETELKTLSREYNRGNGFVVIYGRRRIGKTTLIKEFIQGKKAFYFLATQEIETLCLRRFSKTIAAVTGNEWIERANFTDWVDLFRMIPAWQTDEKKIIVIDEFPYLVQNNPAFPSILQRIWDEDLKDKNIMLILCGSLIHMMKKSTLSYDSPLYGRRTAQIQLQPLSFPEIRAEQQNIPFCDSVSRYAITGGVPKYMEFFQEGMLKDQIRQHILSCSGFLYEEPKFLLSEEVRAPQSYFSILHTIAAGEHKLGKIAASLRAEQSQLMPYLATLIELGFLEKRIPLTEKNPDRSKRGLYMISDNFLRFWFHYVYPWRGELELGNTRIVEEQLESDFESYFTAFVWEDICAQIFANLCRRGEVPFTPSRIGTYQSNDSRVEIDLLAVDNSDGRFLIGECKYHQQPVDADVYFSLRDKVSASAEIRNSLGNMQPLYGIFSKSGFTQRLMDLAQNNPELLLFNEDQLLNMNSAQKAGFNERNKNTEFPKK